MVRVGYQQKVAAAIAALAAAAIGVAALFVHRSVKRQVFEEVRTQALSIATTAAAMVPADLHRQIRTQTDEDSEAYRRDRKSVV